MSLSFEDQPSQGYSERELIAMVRAKLKYTRPDLSASHVTDSHISFELQDAKFHKNALANQPVGAAVREVLAEINSLRFDMLRR